MGPGVEGLTWFPPLGFRLPLSATVDGARVVVSQRRRTTSWLSRSEEAWPWTGGPRGPVEVRGELLLLFYGRTLREVLEACLESACLYACRPVLNHGPTRTNRPEG